jgi:hypothetical protein
MPLERGLFPGLMSWKEAFSMAKGHHCLPQLDDMPHLRCPIAACLLVCSHLTPEEESQLNVTFLLLDRAASSGAFLPCCLLVLIKGSKPMPTLRVAMVLRRPPSISTTGGAHLNDEPSVSELR